MALPASQARSRQSTNAQRPPARRRQLGVVERRRRQPARTRNWVVVFAAALAIGSLLAVVGARAYMTEGQVRLAKLQEQLSAQVDQNRNLELRVAQLQQPANVLAEAKKQGLVVPGHVTDVPEVSSSAPQVTASSSASTGSSSVGESADPPSSHTASAARSGSR
jgi:cell division protein FtsL